MSDISQSPEYAFQVLKFREEKQNPLFIFQRSNSPTCVTTNNCASPPVLLIRCLCCPVADAGKIVFSLSDGHGRLRLSDP